MNKNINIYLGLFLAVLFLFSGLSYADTNGIWQFANDTRGGTFGSDEQILTTNYTFINPVYFDKPLLSLTNPIYLIDIAATTKLNNLVSNTFTSNSATINGNLVVTNSISGASISSSGAVSANTVTTTGAITGTSISSSGAVSANTVTATGAINGASISSSGAVSANTVTATGAINGASISSSGAITSGTTITANQITTNTIKSNVGGDVVIQLG